MVFCGAAIVIPIILCFLSMIMLFMAVGKKTMFLPTVFTFATSAEMVLVMMTMTVHVGREQKGKHAEKRKQRRKRKKTRVLTGTMTKKTTKRMNRKIKTVMLLSER